MRIQPQGEDEGILRLRVDVRGRARTPHVRFMRLSGLSLHCRRPMNWKLKIWTDSMYLCVRLIARSAA
jgi:hypothetical protein